MTWGMALPGNFGEFFPDGDYVGWDEALAEYFNNQMSAEEKALFEPTDSSSYNYYVAEKLINAPGLKRTDMPAFSTIAAHEAPKRFKTVKKYTSLGSLIMLTGRILAVDEHLKNIIERFEPGVHHFFPIEIVMPKDVAFPKKYFVMAIGQYIDSFSPEQSHPASWENRIEGYYGFDNDKKSMAGLALSKQTFGNAHLWRERWMLSALICFSDQLMGEITRSGLRVPKHCKLKEI